MLLILGSSLLSATRYHQRFVPGSHDPIDRTLCSVVLGSWPKHTASCDYTCGFILAALRRCASGECLLLAMTTWHMWSEVRLLNPAGARGVTHPCVPRRHSLVSPTVHASCGASTKLWSSNRICDRASKAYARTNPLAVLSRAGS